MKTSAAAAAAALTAEQVANSEMAANPHRRNRQPRAAAH